MKVFVVLVALLSVAVAQDTFDNPNYSFQYAVADPVTGDQKSQSESRNGDQVQGYYQLLEPDGLYRTVTYVSDPVGGFRAQVSKGAPQAARAAVPVPAVPKAAPVVVAPKPVPPPAPIVPSASSAYPYYAAYPGYAAYPYSSYPYPYYNGYYPYYSGGYYPYYNYKK